MERDDNGLTCHERHTILHKTVIYDRTPRNYRHFLVQARRARLLHPYCTEFIKLSRSVFEAWRLVEFHRPNWLTKSRDLTTPIGDCCTPNRRDQCHTEVDRQSRAEWLLDLYNAHQLLILDFARVMELWNKNNLNGELQKWEKPATLMRLRL